MTAALAQVRRHAKQLQRSGWQRDAAILAAYDAGVPVTRIAKAAGLTIGRVYQVLQLEQRNR